MSACAGSYFGSIRVHPVTHSAECPVCARRFAHADMAGGFKDNIPLHSPTPPRYVEAYHVADRRDAQSMSIYARVKLTTRGRMMLLSGLAAFDREVMQN